MISHKFQSQIFQKPNVSEYKSLETMLIYLFLKILFIYFLDRGEGKEKERERNINVWLPLVCLLLETWPAAQACVLTGNQTSNPLVCRLALNPLNHTS